MEDFVGIEVEHPESHPQGAESLTNLEKDIQVIEASAYTVKSVPKRPMYQNDTNQFSWSVTNTVASVLVLGLPLLSWLFMMNRLRKRASVDSASNVEVLARYRREREQAKKKEDSLRKVS